MATSHFEVKDLTKDPRFNERFYVVGEPHLKYYYGVTLKSSTGNNIGALCVLDQQERQISPEKAEMLKIIADEIVDRLKTYKTIETLRHTVREARQTKMKVAHDIRGPLNGIIGLAGIIAEQGEANKLEDVLQFIAMIQKSGNSILELADEILSDEKGSYRSAKKAAGNNFNITVFKEKLEKLYVPQTISKDIVFTVQTNDACKQIPIAKNKLLQIAGNLISNAVKFTPEKGRILVELNLEMRNNQNVLHLVVEELWYWHYR